MIAEQCEKKVDKDELSDSMTTIDKQVPLVLSLTESASEY